MLLAISPFAFVDRPVRPAEFSEPRLLSKHIISLVVRVVWLVHLTVTVHLIPQPLAIILTARLPGIDALPRDEVVLKLAREATSVGPEKLAGSFLFSLMEIAFKP